jgi:hypothetical protein
LLQKTHQNNKLALWPDRGGSISLNDAKGTLVDAKITKAFDRSASFNVLKDFVLDTISENRVVFVKLGWARGCIVGEYGGRS